MASVTPNNWKNKWGTSTRKCSCGSWKQHWINHSGKSWPIRCSVLGCGNPATVGAHVNNSKISGEQIIPMCHPCNQFGGEFDLKLFTTIVSANQNNTCK